MALPNFESFYTVPVHIDNLNFVGRRLGTIFIMKYSGLHKAQQLRWQTEKLEIERSRIQTLPGSNNTDFYEHVFFCRFL